MMTSKAALVVALVAIASGVSCARAPKQPDPGEGYTLETTGAVIGRDVPQQTNERDTTVGEVSTRLASQICEREARCHGGAQVSQQCLRVFTRLAALEVVSWPCSPAATRARAKECLASLNAEPCQMSLATKPALCEASEACPDTRANLVPQGAVLAQRWPAVGAAGAASFDGRAAISALDAIDVRPCLAKRNDEGLVEGQQPDQPELRRTASSLAHVTVTFAPDGGVLTSQLDRGPDGSAVDLWGTPTGECIVERIRKARVPQFQGPPADVGVTLRLD